MGVAILSLLMAIFGLCAGETKKFANIRCYSDVTNHAERENKHDEYSVQTRL